MRILISITVIMAIIPILGFVYISTGIGKWFYHDILKWHIPSNKENFDGWFYHTTCKYCDKKIMQDSQGNWF